MIKFIQFQVAATILTALFIGNTLTAQISFSTQSNYKYLKGNEAVSLASNWYLSGFDDSLWSDGTAPFRYGDGTGGTDLPDMSGNYSTVFLRTTFNAEKIDSLGNVIITADWDDGFVLWINGQEVLSQQAPATRTYNALASDFHEYGEIQNFSFNKEDLNLIEGANTIAVLGCNITLDGSSDFYFDMAINAIKEVPDMPEVIDSVGISFSHESGFYGSNFTLTLTSPQSDANIVYTLDGSNPQDSPTRITGGSSQTVTINPSSTTNRPTTPAVLVRASIVKSGLKASKPETRTFIYLDRVKTQAYPGGNWPNYDVNGQIIDLDMDQNVTNSSQYSSQFIDAMLDIPTLSVVTNNANLFDPVTGIYVNADQHGIEWEKECSFELIQPDGSESFNVNAGLRIRGGWSRHDEFPKHSFRLFFRSEYGDSKLEFPLFGDEGTNEFDKIDLRTSQNYAWSRGDNRNTMVREVFSRDSQRDMDQPYTRSRYYHLYINGMYWGVFQTQERSEARFAADYFGDKSEDYDVIKAVTEEGGFSHYVGATDGNLDSWRKVWDKTNLGYNTNTKYFSLEGKNDLGEALKNTEVLVDIDNLIDYMMTIFYTGNFDAPTSSFGNNSNTNNFYAIKNRNDRSSGFIFFNHDAEHSLFSDPVSPGIGIQEDRVNLDMSVSGFSVFHPQWLHKKLSLNEEYRIRFADRAMKHLSYNGVFTEDESLERFNARAEELDMAIIGESARWGDRNGGDAYTKDNAWIPELDKVRYDFFPVRTDIVWGQLLDANLLTNVTAPRFENNGERINDSRVFLTETIPVTFENPSSGQIYYTLNGEDPRMIGGEISPNAILIESGSGIYISQSAVLKARVKRDSRWSTLRHVDFVAEQISYGSFKVTEVNYHPLDSIKGTDTTSGKSFEFIEFKNTHTKNAVNLSGLVIDSAIYFEFPEYMLLAPQQHIVIASKPGSFYNRYGLIAEGNFKKNFSNSGERVLITNKQGNIVMDFRYSDEHPWPIAADGQGRTLSAAYKNPWGDPNHFSYWTRSSKNNGTPYADDEYASAIEENLTDEINGSFSAYPNPTKNLIIVKYDGNSDGNFALKLYDVNGAVILDQNYFEEATISLDDLNVAVGIYILNIEYNNQIDTRKVVYTP